MQRRGGSCGLLPSSEAWPIGAIATGRVLCALSRVALTAPITSGRSDPSPDVNVELSADRARAARRRPGDGLS